MPRHPGDCRLDGLNRLAVIAVLHPLSDRLVDRGSENGAPLRIVHGGALDRFGRRCRFSPCRVLQTNAQQQGRDARYPAGTGTKRLWRDMMSLPVFPGGGRGYGNAPPREGLADFILVRVAIAASFRQLTCFPPTWGTSATGRESGGQGEAWLESTDCGRIVGRLPAQPQRNAAKKIAAGPVCGGRLQDYERERKFLHTKTRLGRRPGCQFR